MISSAYKALKANPLKTILIYFSLIFSITAMFLISSISSGIINMYSSILKNDGNIIVTQKNISDTFFSNVDINLLTKIDNIPNIKSSSAVIVGASPIEKLPIIAVYGVSKNRFSNYKLIKDTYPKDKEVLVGESIYKQLLNKKLINIANTDYKISGVFKSDVGFENGGVILNIKDAGKIFNKSASMLMINTKVDTNIDLLLKQINSLSKEVEAKSTQSFVDNYNQFKIIQSSSNVISFIAFAMGLLGIISIMSITINQRKSEFGIKRAIGIPMRKVVFQIITESFILGVISFISALLLSELVLYFIKNSTLLQGYVNGEITSSLSIYIFITSILMAMVGSIIPALNAAKTDPVILIQGNRI